MLRSKEVFWYQVYPTSYPILTPEEQDAVIDDFKAFLNMLRKPIDIYALRYPIEVEHEDIKVRGWAYEFYIASQEPLDKVPLRLTPLISPPELPMPEGITSKAFIWRGTCFSAVVVTGLPSTLTEGFFTQVLEHIPIVRLSVIPIRDDIAYTIIKKKHRLIRAIVASYEVEGRIGDMKIRTVHERISRLLHELVRRETRLFITSLIGLVPGSSPKESWDNALEAERFLESLGFEADVPKWVHYKLWLHNLSVNIFTETHTLGAFYPFISTTLTEPGGILLGLSLIDESPITLDIFSHVNYNVMVLGIPGSGKSTLAKKIVYNYDKALAGEIDIYIIDRTGEYIPLAKELKLQVIEPKHGEELGLDPISLLPPEAAVRFIAEHTKMEPRYIAELRKLTPKSRSLEEVLKNASQDLKMYIESLIEGPFGYVFRGKRLNIGNRVVVSLHNLLTDEEKVLVAGLVAPAFRISIERAPRSKRKIVVIDEFAYMLKDPALAWWCESFSRDDRKLFAALIFLTQQPSDVYGNSVGRTIARNAALKFLLMHDHDSLREVSELLGLTPMEQEILSKVDIGEGILLAENIRLPLRIILSSKERELVETRPWIQPTA